MTSTLTSDGIVKLALPPIADLAYADALKASLIEALDARQGMEIDASAVQRVTTPCLQVLAAAVMSFGETEGTPLTFTETSPAFRDAVKTVGFTAKLGITEQ